MWSNLRLDSAADAPSFSLANSVADPTQQGSRLRPPQQDVCGESSSAGPSSPQERKVRGGNAFSSLFMSYRRLQSTLSARCLPSVNEEADSSDDDDVSVVSENEEVDRLERLTPPKRRAPPNDAPLLPDPVMAQVSQATAERLQRCALVQQQCFAHTGILLPLFAVEKAAQRDGRRPLRHSLADVKDYLKESGTPHQQELAVRRPEAYPVEWKEEMEETRAKDDSPENAAMVRE